MTRSRDISQYFLVPLTTLIPNRELTFDVYLYFSHNNHVMRWMAAGATPNDEFLGRYRAKGIHEIWIYTDDKSSLETYRHPTTPTAAPKTVLSEKTAEGAVINAVLRSPDLTTEEQSAIVQEVARSVVAELHQPQDPAKETETREKARRVVEEVVVDAIKKTQSIAEEIWRLADLNPEFEHSVNVATYAVIFAMAFGRIDTDLLADLALAALLHDVGLSQIPLSIARLAERTMTEPQLNIYSKHVDLASDLIRQHPEAIRPRVIEILLQHHERFSGNGYPRRLKGFEFDDIAQLLAMGNLLDNIANGHLDDVRRSIREAFEYLRSVETSSTLPEFYNPDIFTHISTWLKQKEQDGQSIEDAVNVVKNQVHSLVTKTAA